MDLPTEAIGSIPRPGYLVDGMAARGRGEIDDRELDRLRDRAVGETIALFEETGSPVLTDGEQSKPSFVTYPVDGLDTLAPDGAVIPFADGHTRQLPRLTGGPFRYRRYADQYLRRARTFTGKPVKQAVVAASALSLLYPQDGIADYPQEAFLADLVDEAETDIRHCLDAGPATVQIDFTEGRLALKLDPSGGLLRQFVALNNQVLARFGDEERRRIGVHTCPGGDHDSVHSSDVPYEQLLPTLFELNAGNFYLQLASEANPQDVLAAIQKYSKPEQRIFVGVTDPIDPRVETADEVEERVLAAAGYIPPERLGTCDDCGFSPFADDVSTSRDIAFAKISARVAGTRAAGEKLGD